MKVMVYNVEELEAGVREQDAPIAGGQMVDAYSNDQLESEIQSEDLSLDDIEQLEEEEKETQDKRPALSIFTTDLVIKYDESSHKYPVTANRKLKPKSLVRVLRKGGRYIFNLGSVNFFEMLILNLFLVVYCYQMETELITEMQESGKSDATLSTSAIPHSMSTPYILAHQYVMFQAAYNLGDLLSLSSLQQVTLEQPWVPTLFQIVNFILWTINTALGFPIANFNFVFLWSIWVGCQGGTSFTNFLFMANTRTNLDCDMKLSYYERELCVNLLLIAQDIGVFFAGLVGYWVQSLFFTGALYNQPA